MSFGAHLLSLDAAAETERIVGLLRESVGKTLRRRGAVVGISGGIDSSVSLALSVRAFGANRVLALILPEKDSDPASATLAQTLARQFGVEPLVEDLTPALEGMGCYARRDEAIRRVFPEYGAGCKAKIVLPKSLLEDDTLNIFSLTVIMPDGAARTKRLPSAEYLQIVAASNFKQRARMSALYYHAERLNYAVVGTPNRNEHEQGFFVKHGDGGYDVKPIAHLLKTQVYHLADYLGIPDEIRARTPITDTYSAHQSQEEFFFRLPFETMDLLWVAHEGGYPLAEVAQYMGLTEAQVRRVYADFERKRQTTDYLRAAPLGISDLLIPEAI